MVNPVVLICTHNRIGITCYNIESLRKQSLIPKIILVASDLREVVIFRKRFPELMICRYPNLPLGAKWDYGVQVSRNLNANPLIILGSDDILGEFFIENCSKLTQETHESIGLKRWYVHHKGKAYFCEYLAKQPLGGGRAYSKRLLDKIDWKLFDATKNRHLDDFSNEHIHAIVDLELHAIKGNWSVMNDFNLNHPNIKVLSIHNSKDLLPDYDG